MKIALQVAGRRDPELDKLNVPWSMDVVPDKHKKLFVMVNPIIDLARPFFAPPNVPAERARILQAAFAQPRQGSGVQGGDATASPRSNRLTFPAPRWTPRSSRS